MAAAAAATMRSIGQISRAMQQIGTAGNAAGNSISRMARSADDAADSLGGFMGAVQSATATLRAFSRLQDTLGATTGETAALRILGKGLGLGDIRGMAATLRQNSLSGLGAATATRFGIPIQPHDIGSAANEGQNLLKALSGLRETFKAAGGGERGLSAALADARNLGIENAIQVVRIHDDMWAQILKDGQEARGMLGQEHQTRALQLSITMARLSEKWEFLKTLFQAAFIPILEKATNYLIGFTRLLAAIPFSGVRQQDIDAALNANTASVDRNTRAIDNLSGIYGGGRRVRGAIPGEFGPGYGYRLQGALRAHGLRLGYYSVSI